MTQHLQPRQRGHGCGNSQRRLAAILICFILQACGIAPLQTKEQASVAKPGEVPIEVAAELPPVRSSPEAGRSAPQEQQQQQQQRQRPSENRLGENPAAGPQGQAGTPQSSPRVRGADVRRADGRVKAGKAQSPTSVIERGMTLPSDAAALQNPATSTGPSVLAAPEKTLLEKETEKIDGLVKGSAGVSSPNKAKAGDSFAVYLRVSPDGAVQDLLRSLKQEIPGNETVLGRGNIGLTPRMTAGLSGFGFEILPKDVVTQAVSAKDPTTWVWQVKPVESGRLTLSFTLSGTLLIEGKEVPRNYYYTQDVEVAVSPMGFVSKYWQWLVTTLAIPAIAWLWSWWKRPGAAALRPFFRARERSRTGARVG